MALAPQCAVCARVIDTPVAGAVCDQCWQQVSLLRGPLCRTCGDQLPSWRTISAADEQCPRCRRLPGLIAATRSAGHYEGALRAILHAFKYDGRSQLARPLAALTHAAGASLLEDADAVVPVPLHPWRLARRGFNQADELARRLGIPVVRALWRTRPTGPQASLHASARRRNVRGAFRLSPLLTSQTRRARLEDRAVVLVDDVRTTGATLEACAGALRAAGVREVRALTVARADLHALRHEPRRKLDRELLTT